MTTFSICEILTWLGPGLGRWCGLGLGQACIDLNLAECQIITAPELHNEVATIRMTIDCLALSLFHRTSINSTWLVVTNSWGCLGGVVIGGTNLEVCKPVPCKKD